MMNKDKKGTGSFFSQFKKFASTVDHLVEEYKQSVSDKNNHEFCAPQVCKNITDMLNDLKQLKVCKCCPVSEFIGTRIFTSLCQYFIPTMLKNVISRKK